MTPPTPPPPPSGDRDRLLDRLAQLLADQLSLARSGDCDAVLRSADEISSLLAEAGSCPQPLSTEQLERLSGILDVHRQIGLVMAQKKDEVARQLRRATQGRKTLAAYRQARP